MSNEFQSPATKPTEAELEAMIRHEYYNTEPSKMGYVATDGQSDMLMTCTVVLASGASVCNTICFGVSAANPEAEPFPGYFSHMKNKAKESVMTALKLEFGYSPEEAYGLPMKEAA